MEIEIFKNLTACMVPEEALTANSAQANHRKRWNKISD